MSSLNLLTNEQLLITLQQKSAAERKITLEILELLEQVDRRSLHLERGYGSLLEFCVRELKYSESAAYRRIAAMRVAKEVPEVKKSIEQGSMNLATVSQAQTFFRQEKKYRAKVYSKNEKQAILHSLENKSKREAEKLLLQKSPDLSKPEVVRQVTENQTRITINIDQSLSAQLDELKNKYSHINPNPSFAELIQLMATQLLKGSSKRPQLIHTKSLQPSRYIPAATRRFIFERDKGCCTFENPLTKKKCGSKFQLEVDHIHAFSLGGSNAAENLRLACRNHNQYLWRTSAGT